MTSARARLYGVGVATPTGTLDQDTAATLAEARCCTSARQQSWLRRIYRHTEVRQRGSVLLDAVDVANREAAGFEAFYPLAASSTEHGPTTAARLQRYVEEAGPLAQTACHAALLDATIPAAEITHVVTVSCTGLVSPGLDVELIQCLGLSLNVGRLNLGFMGCHGALNGLRASSGLAQSQPDARVLLCCVELCSLHFQYGWDAQKIVANGLFADGAGAAVLGPGDKEADGWHLVDTTSRLARSSSDSMTWKVGDHGFEMTLSSDVPKLIRGSARVWIEDWLARYGLTISDVAHWAIHPGGPEIIRSVTKALALPEAAGRVSAS
ncbi:MAG TPA: hypothetical protein VFM75_06625, partial [Modicisalibacter sp.]|nr:hypothetical protein [Modicisalibacter sp.]